MASERIGLTRKDLAVVRKFLAGYEDVDDDEFESIVADLRLSRHADATHVDNVARMALSAPLRRLGGKKLPLPTGSPSWELPKWEWNTSVEGTRVNLDLPEVWTNDYADQVVSATFVAGGVVLYHYGLRWTTFDLGGWGSLHFQDYTWVDDPVGFGEIVARYLLGPRKRAQADIEALASRLEIFFRKHPAFVERTTLEGVVSPND